MSSPLHSGLIAPDKGQLEALARLGESRDWLVIKGWLEKSLNVLGRNAYAEDYAARWAQGQGQALGTLIEDAEGAGEKLKQIRDHEAKAGSEPAELIG